MSISSVSNAQNSAKTDSSSSLASLSDNYTMFLSLLTTQMKNQSPLDPMDADQFTSQLVQYSSVEQLIKMNTNFEDMKSSLEASNLASLVNYVGSTVTIDGSTQSMADGKVAWTVNSAKSSTATITVKDADGKTVYTEQKSLNAGDNSYTWNGKGADGTTYNTGDYTISVSAKTSSGAKVTTNSNLTGKVDSLEWTDGTPYLVIGGTKYPTSRVTSISASS